MTGVVTSLASEVRVRESGPDCSVGLSTVVLVLVEVEVVEVGLIRLGMEESSSSLITGSQVRARGSAIQQGQSV